MPLPLPLPRRRSASTAAAVPPTSSSTAGRRAARSTEHASRSQHTTREAGCHPTARRLQSCAAAKSTVCDVVGMSTSGLAGRCAACRSTARSSSLISECCITTTSARGCLVNSIKSSLLTAETLAGFYSQFAHSPMSTRFSACESRTETFVHVLPCKPALD